MKKHILILFSLSLAFFACEDTEEAIYTGESLSYFTNGTSGNYYVQDIDDNFFEIIVGITDASTSDRTVSVSVDPASTVPADQYTLDDLFIPSGSNIGSIKVYGDYDSVVSGTSLILNLDSVQGSNVATFDNVYTLDFYQFCPFVRDEFLGTWDADEEGYTVYPVNVTAGTLPNEIIISNVWDSDPNSTTSVYLDDSDPSNFVLDFPDYTENYLYDHATYGPAYIDNAYGTFDACTKTIDMYFQVRVDAGLFAETHITFTIQ